MLNLGLSEDELAWFEAAEKRQELRGIKRYHIYHPMFYRTNVYIHSIRVALLVLELAETLKDVLKFDHHKAVLMALIHDDPEIITGDLQAGKKDKMTAEELKALKARDEKAAHEIATYFPEKLGEYNYYDLLKEVSDKESTEARIVDICDKLDGLGEAFHEIFAGNRRFVTPVDTEKYGYITTPPEYYQTFFQKIYERHPTLRHIILKRLTFLIFPEGNWTELIEKKWPHSEGKLRGPSGLPIYDFWKRTLLKRDRERQLELLTTRTEGIEY